MFADIHTSLFSRRSWTNFFYYGFVAAMKNNFDNSEPYSGVDSVLDFYDLNRGPPIWGCLVIMVGFLIFFTMLAGHALNALCKK